jgi:choline dehydrogenase-like flavoprotein
VLYPRAAALGGCTTHNAMILMYPHNADWDGIAELTGDRSWRAEAMHRYFVRARELPPPLAVSAARDAGLDPTKHGWNGWLSTERAIPKTAFSTSR